MAELLQVTAILLGLWALFCLAGMAVCYLPILFWYGALALFYGVVCLGYGALWVLLWLMRLGESALQPWLRRRAIKREMRWSRRKQLEARGRIDGLFALANQAMDNANARR